MLKLKEAYMVNGNGSGRFRDPWFYVALAIFGGSTGGVSFLAGGAGADGNITVAQHAKLVEHITNEDARQAAALELKPHLKAIQGQLTRIEGQLDRINRSLYYRSGGRPRRDGDVSVVP